MNIHMKKDIHLCCEYQDKLLHLHIYMCICNYRYINTCIGKTNGSLEWWNVNLHIDAQNISENQGDIDITRAGALANVNINGSSIFQSTPYGRGVIICNKNQNISRGNMNNSNNNEIRESNIIPKRTDFFDISLQGYPKDTLALKKVFSPLDEDVSTYGEGPSTCLATIKEKILGVKWGVPGRFLPPTHSGLELLIMTESAAIHVIKIPVEMCNNILIKDVNDIAVNNKNDKSNENIISLNKPKYLLKKSLNYQNNMRLNSNKSNTSVNSTNPDLFYSNPATVNSTTGIDVYIYI